MNPNLTQLDFIQECYIRGLYTQDYQMTRKYQYLIRGHQGEKIMYDWLKRNLPPHTLIIHDIWMEYRGITQIDLLVLINNLIWIIEVKHYNGYFQYKDNVCSLNGYRMDKDQIAQMRNRLLIIEDIIKLSKKDFQIKGTMVFTHENSEISIPPEVTFETLTLNQVKRYFTHEITTTLKRSKQSILPHLKKYETNSTFLMPSLKEDDFLFLKKGVYCPVCYSFDLSPTNRSFICESCHHRELKQLSILRQYCCQGVLQHNKTYIRNKEIHILSNKTIDDSTIRKTLKPKIQHRIKRKQLNYFNHALPYNKFIKKEEGGK